MSNSVYNLIVQALSSTVPERMADSMLQAALQDLSLNAEDVTPQEMQMVLSGPLLERLSSTVPTGRARAELEGLSRRLQLSYPKAPTLFDNAAAQNPTQTPVARPAPAAVDLSADDFEFDDPDYLGASQAQPYDLDSAAGQEKLIQDLARMQGVQGVMISRANGEVLRVKAMRDATSLSSVIAATAMLFQKRHLKLMAAEFQGQTVCMRPLGGYCVAVVAGRQVNIGRLLTEMQQVRCTA